MRFAALLIWFVGAQTETLGETLHDVIKNSNEQQRGERKCTVESACLSPTTCDLCLCQRGNCHLKLETGDTGVCVGVRNQT